MNETIAEFAIPKALCVVLFYFAMGVLLYWALTNDWGASEHKQIESAWKFLLPIAAICWIWLAWLSLIILKLIFFNQAKAVWLENGKIIHISKYNTSISVNELDEICVGETGPLKLKRIVFKNKNGALKVIPTGILKSSSDIILSRIKAAIATS